MDPVIIEVESLTRVYLRGTLELRLLRYTDGLAEGELFLLDAPATSGEEQP
jgi:hypothetical protein